MLLSHDHLNCYSIDRSPFCSVTFQSHRWSGWPGAVCLDCLEDDPSEICLADDCGCSCHSWHQSDYTVEG